MLKLHLEAAMSAFHVNLSAQLGGLIDEEI
jgi:hypothetical protein